MVNSVEFIMKVTFALMVWILFLSTVLYTQENAKTREVVKGIKSDNEFIMEKLSKVESQNDSLEKNILNKFSTGHFF